VWGHDFRITYVEIDNPPYPRPRVSPEMFQWYAKNVMWLRAVIPYAFGTTTPRQISETFQAIQMDLPT